MILSALLLLQSTPTPTPTPSPPPACTSAEHRQFDFWVGEWEVTPNIKGAVPIANSKIEKLHSGCTIRENWMPFKGTGGGSLNAFDPGDGRWHQHWQDSSGGIVPFQGGMAKDEMVLTGWWRGYNGPGKHLLTRMRYSLQSDGSVRQHGEVSADHGVTWTTGFDFIYRRKPVQ
jgi:hypothetical protein